MTEVRDILGELGIEIRQESVRRKDGRLEFSALCPHHFDGTKQETEPSWSINSETGKHVCYACGFSGDLEYLIEVVAGVSKEVAKKRSHKGARALNRIRRMDPWGGERPVPIPPMNEARVMAYPDAPDWALEKRRISREAVDHFGIRWDPKQDAWIIPIRDPETYKSFGFQLKGEGNHVFKNLPAGIAKSTTLFGIEHVNGGTVVVVESPLDAVLLWTLGYTAVAIMGRTISDDQWALLISRADRLILALDNDAAGIKETYAVHGLRKQGQTWRRAKWLKDYSRLIPIRLFDYTHTGEAKDVGEADIWKIHQGLKEAHSMLIARVGRAS